MAASVEELLATTLRFVGGPVETIYLNQTRTREWDCRTVGSHGT